MSKEGLDALSMAIACRIARKSGRPVRRAGKPLSLTALHVLERSALQRVAAAGIRVKERK